MAEDKNNGEDTPTGGTSPDKKARRGRFGSRRSGSSVAGSATDAASNDTGDAVAETERQTTLVADKQDETETSETRSTAKSKRSHESAEDERLRKIADDMTSNIRQSSPTPTWYIAIMLGFMIIGLLWIMTFYISNQALPIPDLSFWNIAIGIGLMMIGLIMTTRWR